MRKLVLVTIALLLFGSVGSRSSVAEIPGGAIRIIVPFSAGGPTEVLARVVGRLLGEKLGVRTYVENKPGASGMVGTEQVAKAPADGTVLLLTATHHVITPSIYKNLPYDTRKDFSPLPWWRLRRTRFLSAIVSRPSRSGN